VAEYLPSKHEVLSLNSNTANNNNNKHLSILSQIELSIVKMNNGCDQKNKNEKQCATISRQNEITKTMTKGLQILSVKKL
jgi:hypothetical protein